MYEIEESQTTQYRLDGKTFYSRHDADAHLASIMARPTWAEYAAQTWPDLMPLYGHEIAEVMGWGSAESPICCGKPVDVFDILGSVSRARCQTCKKEVANLLAGHFSNGCIAFVDYDQFRFETNTDPCMVILHSGDTTVEDYR